MIELTKRQKEDLQAVYDTQKDRLEAIEKNENPHDVPCKLCERYTGKNSALSCASCMPQITGWVSMCAKVARYHIKQKTPPQEVVEWIKEIIRCHQEKGICSSCIANIAICNNLSCLKEFAPYEGIHCMDGKDGGKKHFCSSCFEKLKNGKVMMTITEGSE